MTMQDNVTDVLRALQAGAISVKDAQEKVVNSMLGQPVELPEFVNDFDISKCPAEAVKAMAQDQSVVMAGQVKQWIDKILDAPKSMQVALKKQFLAKVEASLNLLVK